MKKTAIEKYEYIVKKYLNIELEIKDKIKRNNCIGPFADNNAFRKYKTNFCRRLNRISNVIKSNEELEELKHKLQDLASEDGYKWSGPYSELVALDFYSNSRFIHDLKYINTMEASSESGSLAQLNGKTTIDIDLSFTFALTKIFTDIKSYIPTHIEILDNIIEDTQTKTHRKVLIGVNELKSDSFLTIRTDLCLNQNDIKKLLSDAIFQEKSSVTYKTPSGKNYDFRICYCDKNQNILITERSTNQYELASNDKYKFLNYSNKLLKSNYSFLTFVLNPWFNKEDFDMDQTYFRSVARRVFIELEKDDTIAKNYFPKENSNTTITFSDISKNIAGIVFIKDKSITATKRDFLYEGYIYLNPNYINKAPLSIFDLCDFSQGSSLCKIVDMDDFQYDNY